MSWRGILTLLLLAAVALSGWSVWRQHRPGERGPVASARSDYVLQDFEIVTLNSQGQEAFTLRAPRLARSPADRTMTLQTPLFQFPDRSGGHWQVRSRQGWVSAKADEVRLTGDVVADPPPGGSRQMRMTTQRLNVFPNEDRASSPALVTFTDRTSIIRGRGMEVDLRSKRYRLLSDVRSRYAIRR